MSQKKRYLSLFSAVCLLVSIVFIQTVCCFAQEESSPADKAFQALQKEYKGPEAVAAEDVSEAPVENVPGLREIIVRLIYSLVVVVFVLVIGLYALRRFLKIRKPGSSAYIHIISQASISPKSSLHLIRVSGKRLLIGEGPDGVRLIAEIPDTEGHPLDEELLPEATAGGEGRFRRNLEQEVSDVQQGLLIERVQNVVKNCRDYLGRLKQGSGKNA